MQIGWLDTGHYYVLNHCKNHIYELNNYAWDEKKPNRPEEVNSKDHTINASQYSFLGYRLGIGLMPYNN